MPTRDTAWPNGTPCWVDYNAPDFDQAKSFYAGVLGWSYTDPEPEYAGYVTCLVHDREAAGIGPQQDPSMPTAWTTYFATDDVDAAVSRISGAGGSVALPAMDVGPMGRMAIAVDPQGHPFGLWQAGSQPGVRIYNEPGALVWNEAAVDDPEDARAFYAEVFGFRFDEVEGADGYTTFATGDRPLGGLGGHQEGSPKGWATCFSVASTDDAVAAVERGSGKVTMAAMDTPFGRFAVVEDPWGAAFSVMQDPSTG